MAINFPDSPSNGATFTSGGITFTYNSTDGTWSGSTGAAAGTFTNLTATGTVSLSNFSSTGIDDNADATAITIDSNENVGIGVTSMVNPLQISVTPNADSKTSGSAFDGGAIRLDGSLGSADSEVGILAGANDGLSSGIGFARQDGSTWGTQLRFYTHDTGITTTDELTERARIDASGRLGINTSSPTQLLDVSGTATFGSGTTRITTYSDSSYSGIFNGSSLTSDESIYMGADATFFYVKGSEIARFDYSGSYSGFLIGTTSIGGDGISLMPRYSGSGTTSQLRFNRAATSTIGSAILFMDGGVIKGYVNYTNTSTTYSTTSDQRVKENIVDAPAGNIDEIRIRSFDWKADGSHQKYGVIAQELISVAPDAVSVGDDEDETMGVDHSKLVPMMIKEIQDLRTRVQELEAKQGGD